MRDAVERHCLEIDRTNQRGGRMLSIVDLVEASTLSREIAAYSLAAIGRGASFMVGALPGGAGKTTVMGALLNLVPREVELAPADGMAAVERGLRSPDPRRCYICHEIGDGAYYAYLWGEELRAYFELPRLGHMLATNLHADTFEQARDQVCRTNGVPEARFRRMNLLYFLSVGRSGFGFRRRIAEVWEGDGSAEHSRVFGGDAGASLARSRLVPAEELERALAAIDRLRAAGARTTQEVRAAILESWPASP